MRTLFVLFACACLQGCLFFYIPGSVTSSVGDALTGAEGAHCVPDRAKVGDTINFGAGRSGTVKSLSGTSSRCQNPEMPIRALIVVDEATNVRTWVQPTTK